MNFADRLRQRHIEKKLEKAILEKDPDGVQLALQEGARKVNHKSSGMAMYGSTWKYQTHDPVELAEQKQSGPEIVEIVKQGMQQPAPALEGTSLVDFIAGQGGLLEERREKRLTKKLSKALLANDLEAVREALNAGATRVDVSQGYSPMGMGFMPINRFRDPIEACQRMEMAPEILELLKSRLAPQGPKSSMGLS